MSERKLIIPLSKGSVNRTLDRTVQGGVTEYADTSINLTLKRQRARIHESRTRKVSLH